MTVTLYGAGRGGGKTTWLIDQTEEDVSDEKRIAIVVPAHNFMKHADYAVSGWVEVYTEKNFERARGVRFDHIYIDDADLFQDDPAVLCAQVAPGVPVTMTYTPSPYGQALPTCASRPNSQDSEPTLSQEEQSLFALSLAVSTGESLKRIMESGLVTSAAAVGLWRI